MRPPGIRLWIASAALCAAAAASAYPTKPIRIIHPYAPGGGTEVQARALSQYLFDSWAQPVVIDGRPGAGSALGTQIAAKAAPDGYTLLFTNAAFSAVPRLSPTPLFDPIRDFAPIVHVGTTPLILVAHTALPPTMSGLLTHAKANPGKLNFGSSGTGAASHLAVEYLMSLTGMDIVHVPYKGSTPAVVALLADEVQLAMFSASAVISHIRSGKIRALGVTTAKRSRLLPDVPTIAEAGVPGYEVLQWSGMLAPAGTPTMIVAKLNQKINAALTTREIREQLSQIGIEPAGGSAEHFASLIRSEVARWEKLIRQGGIKSN